MYSVQSLAVCQPALYSLPQQLTVLLTVDFVLFAFCFFIKLYLCFLDDIHFVWTGTRQKLAEYELYLNNLIPGIKVTLTAHSEIIEFLDVFIYKVPYGPGMAQLQTRVFFKPTDTHQLLHGSSYHPKHTTKGILKSQILRFKRISSCWGGF